MSKPLEGLDWKVRSKAFDDIRDARIARLPEHVRRAITP